MARETIPIISLFSGCGGMDLGFQRQGFIPIIAIDSDQTAVETYNRNHSPRTAQVGDLSKLSGQNIIRLIEERALEVRPRGVIGGPPCQSFSISNVHGKSKDPRHLLPMHYAEILKTLNKKYHLDFFLFENVVGLKSKQHQKRFREILSALEDAGFNIFEQEVNASWFGVPQSRRRIFVVGINKELYPHADFKFPEGDNVTFSTVRDAIVGLPEPTYFNRSLQPSDISFHPNHWTMNPRSLKFKQSHNKNGRSFRKLAWDKPSWTVAYGHREIHVHPKGKRRLSVFEAMKLQSFPDRYVLAGNFTQQVTQVSNAVPPPLASALAKAIHQTIYAPHKAIQKKMLTWFETNQRKFPWRETDSPYAILLAEKLLQQTSATQAVVSAYNNILSLYPTIEMLAKAKIQKLESIITPLGFKYRATELLKLAQEIVVKHGGRVPDNLKTLLSLPGVGDYIARAVLCFGYGLVVPIVDTNVARFLYRTFGLNGTLPSNPARLRFLSALASGLVPAKAARDFNLAILDLCAKVCVSGEPYCNECPLIGECIHGASFCK